MTRPPNPTTSSSGRRLQWGSLAGLCAGLLVIGRAQVVTGGHLSALAQPAAGWLVVGGTAAVLVGSFPARTLTRALRALGDALTTAAIAPETLITAFAQYASIARRQGVMALEAEVEGARDPFLARALALAVTGTPGEVVHRTLETEAQVAAGVEEENAVVFETAAGYAPTLGMIGAVLGLMQVMRHVDRPAEAGAGVAAAFVSTIYGLALANVVCLPLAARLRARSRADGLRRALTMAGVRALVERAQPRMVEETLAAYLREPRPGARVEAA